MLLWWRRREGKEEARTSQLETTSLLFYDLEGEQRNGGRPESGTAVTRLTDPAIRSKQSDEWRNGERYNVVQLGEIERFLGGVKGRGRREKRRSSPVR